MTSDLRRYPYAAAFFKAHNRLPKGAEDIKILGLEPKHKNWETGHFADRFRVQVPDKPSNIVVWIKLSKRFLNNPLQANS